MSSGKETAFSLYEALFELKSYQDFLINSSSKYFGHFISKLVGTDTLPIVLYTDDGLFSQTGEIRNSRTGERECFFETCCFRIESVDKERCFATVSLLRPLDIHGNDAQSISDVFKLEKTSIRKEVDLACINAIQPLDIHLMKRKVIIEPKW